MTTIAFDGHSIACDGLVCSDWIEHDDHDKIIMNPMHDLLAIGISGVLQQQETFISWLITGKMNYETQPYGNYHLLCIRRDGKIFTVDMNRDYGFQHKFFIHNSIVAIGSGAKYALGAMAVGANATQAVDAAKQFDVYTGGKVQAHELFLGSSPDFE